MKKIPVRATILSALSMVLYIGAGVFSAGKDCVTDLENQNKA